MIDYEGIFFEGISEDILRLLEGKNLGIINDKYHCTFKYKPTKEEIFDDIVGQEVECFLIGYANNGRNSGFEILFPDRFAKYYMNLDESGKKKTPHITTSIKEDSTASDTYKLNFKELKTPIKITGRFGYWIKDEITDIGEISYSKFIKSSIIK